MAYEYVGNVHMHTPFSDGFGTHEELAEAGLRAGLDFLIVTDHNVWVGGVEGYRYQGDRRLLLLVGEEVHDQAREPQKNHLLVFGVDRELAPLAPEPRRLLAAVAEAGGLAFFAHPTDPAAPLFDQPDLSWVDWDLGEFTGLELWNFMSEFKVHLRSIPSALYHAYQPEKVAAGPFAETLRRWDELLAAGRRVVAIGGSDAHALRIQAGPLKRVVFPYEFLFRAVNTHVLTDESLTGEARADRQRIYLALRRGRCFVGYDLPASTKGFRFTAQGKDGAATMGESITGWHGVTLQAWLPQPAELRLLHNGRAVKEMAQAQMAIHIATEPGAYRLEAYLHYKGRRRAWILSNPIYVTA